MKPARVIVPAVVLLALTAPASAQVRVVLYGDDRLAGITEVDVVVILTGEASTGCELSRPELQRGAVAALRGAHVRATISEKASSWHHTVMVNVHQDRSGDGCVSALITELVTQVEGFPEADKFAAPGRWGSILIGPMTLGRENGLVTSPPREHDAAVRAAVRGQASALAERIRRANP